MSYYRRHRKPAAMQPPAAKDDDEIMTDGERRKWIFGSLPRDATPRQLGSRIIIPSRFYCTSYHRRRVNFASSRRPPTCRGCVGVVAEIETWHRKLASNPVSGPDRTLRHYGRRQTAMPSFVLAGNPKLGIETWNLASNFLPGTTP